MEIEVERRAGPSVVEIFKRHAVFTLNAEGVMGLPILVKGSLRYPAPISRSEIESGLTKDHIVVPIVREKQTHYCVFPRCAPEELPVDPASAEWQELYNMPFARMRDFVGALREVLMNQPELIPWLSRNTETLSDLPQFWHEAGFAAIAQLLDYETLAEMADRDLSRFTMRGLDLLDGWCSLSRSEVMPEPVHYLAQVALPNYEWRPREPRLRAMPTRQLHITAGNAPHIPLVSLLRAIATKSAVTLKLPSGALVGGSLIAALAGLVLPDHPFTKVLSIVYWRGGDEQFEAKLLMPDRYDRIAVWGSPDSVRAVKERTPFSKVVSFNPRFGVSLIGQEAFASQDMLNSTAGKMVIDSLVANQKACIASLVHYVEGDNEQVRALAVSVQKMLAQIDAHSPNIYGDAEACDLKRWQTGSLIGCEWFMNFQHGKFISGVVVADQEINLVRHPANRLLVLRPVRELQAALNYLSSATSTVSVYPEQRRIQLRDRIASRGVSQIVPLGESGTFFNGMGHDGMNVLSELVDWKNA